MTNRTVEIKTARLTLRLKTPAEVLAWVESLDDMVRTEISLEWLERIRTLTESDPWLCMFEIVRLADGIAVGSCGFKGPPDSGGMVEIAYGIDQEFRGNGYATEAAVGLVTFARTCQSIALVRAHEG